MCKGGVGVALYSPSCSGCMLSLSLVLSSPQCWCCRCCHSLPLPSLSPHSRPIVVVSPVVPSKRPPAPAIPPASSGLQWGEWVLGHRFVGGFCRSHQPLAPSNPLQRWRWVLESGAGVRRLHSSALVTHPTSRYSYPWDGCAAHRIPPALSLTRLTSYAPANHPSSSGL